MAFNLLEFPPHISKALQSSLSDTLSSGFWSTGPRTFSLEDRFSDIYNRSAISTSSGGTALQLIRYLYPGIKKLAVQSNTYFASILPWLDNSCDIILIGSSNGLLMPDLNSIKSIICEDPDALILTHIGGYPNPHIEEIAFLCRQHNILLIEDCAHSPLVSIGGKFVGTFGDASILSFFPTKPIPAGEGGLLLLKDSDLAIEAKRMRDYGKYKEDNIIYHKLPASINCRMNDFTATIVSTILDYYDELLEQKNCISSLYDNFFKSSSFLRANYTDTSNIAPSYYKYIAFVANTDICTSPVYDSPNQINSILDMNDYPYTFFGDSVFTPHSCLPITASMDPTDVQHVLSYYIV